MISRLLSYGGTAVGTTIALYATLLGLLTTPWIQTQVLYLHAVQMTWGKDLSNPTQFGFAHNQVTPFHLSSGSGQPLFAWHILPLGVYRKHETSLLGEKTGLASDFTASYAFKLLRDDPEAILVIHFHGAGGTVGSGYRCPNYRALSAADPEKIHVLTFDYRGFGRSPGSPTEIGLIEDATAVVRWSLEVAEIPSDRIVIYSQSLGTAVNMAIAEQFAAQTPPIVFAGHILTAPFVDVASLLSTYSIAGTIPILGPVARFQLLFDYLRSFVNEHWSTKDRIAAYVSRMEAEKLPYYLNLLHAQDDYDIPWTHTTELTKHAADATKSGHTDLESIRKESRKQRNDAGSVIEIETKSGLIREDILNYGLHDVIMGTPTISLAVMRVFEPGRYTVKA